MEFALLGPLEVQAADGPLVLGRPKERALLALLLLHANRVVARERLIDELWGERPPETAVKAVQVYVSQLRKVLPPGMLVTQPPGYLLAVEPEAVDLLRFERLVTAAHGVDPARASSLLTEALGLWRGPPLAEFVEEPFARIEAGRLQDLRLAALEERIEADLALGRHGELTGELEALIAQHPHRERLRGHVMLALYRSGRQAEALAAYRAAQAALDQLGLEPGTTLRRLEKQILTQDPSLDLRREGPLAAATTLPGPLVPDSPFPFIGRANELTLLRSLLEQAGQGEGGLVLLSGEAGAGKTRLIREFAHEAAAQGVLVLYGASDASVSTPYQPLREWIEFLLRVCEPGALGESLGASGDLLARLAPELARLTGPAPPARGEVETDRYLLQSAAVELVRRLSSLQPLLLVADDIHWADSESLHFLRRLARTAPEGRLLVVAAFRSGDEVRDELADALADLSRVAGVTRLTAGNLNNEEVSAFIRAETDAEASAELASAIGELTDGTPLLLCELWRELRESGGVEVAESGVYLSRPLADLRGPERVREIVRQRVSRLTSTTHDLVELAAVAGPRFELHVIGESASLEHRELVAAVEEAAGAGMIEELPDPTPAYRFTHELVRRAVYDRISRLRRAELHLRVADALERAHAADPTPVLLDLAHHFTLAAPVAGAERAVDYNLLAGDAAIATAAFDEAAARLSSALELGIDDLRERARVQIELGHVLNELGRHSEAEAILAESQHAATGLEERGLAARALVQRSSQRLFSNPQADPDATIAVAKAAAATFDELGDSQGLAVAARLHALALKGLGREADSRAAAERALVHADASEHQATRRRVIATLVYALSEGPTPVAEGISRCEQLLDAYGDDRVLRALVQRSLSSLLAMAGRFDEARDLVDKSSLVLDELKQLTASGVYRAIAARARELIGDRAGAEEELKAQWLELRDARVDGGPDGRAMNAAYGLARMYCDDGRWDAAADCLSYGGDVPEALHPMRWVVLRLAVSGRLAAHDGRLTDAVTLARRAVEVAERTDRLNERARVWLALAEVQRSAGAEAEADAAVAAALRLYDEKGNVNAAGRLRSAASRAAS